MLLETSTVSHFHAGCYILHRSSQESLDHDACDTAIDTWSEADRDGDWEVAWNNAIFAILAGLHRSLGFSIVPRVPCYAAKPFGKGDKLPRRG